MTASNPYNPYFGPGMIIGPEHAAAASALAAASPQAYATNAGTQPQKRNVQVMALNAFLVCCWFYVRYRCI